ncbi:hypothetical protein QUF72_11145 [Desulfobacterales bacterium HSG2]|nr:hypothetical protein [Desulfobacterales bacterium HSG2]
MAKRPQYNFGADEHFTMNTWCHGKKTELKIYETGGIHGKN